MAGSAGTIQVSVTEKGEFTHHPSLKHVAPNETVTWTSKTGPFTISFKEGSPFGQLTYYAELKDGIWQIETLPAKPARAGHYHYAIAIYVKNEDKEQIHLDAGCPEIIIDRD